ncbi:aminotransferase class I/II-fold pyridoxal phosphate-dependent enzyme, partial [Campylobacter coli]
MKFNDFLNHLSNYEPGKDIEVIAREYGVKEVIKLASNENPFGAPPKAVKVLQENAFKANLYPDDSMVELKGELAQKYSVKNENIIIGAGSDQVIEFAIHSKL